MPTFVKKGPGDSDDKLIAKFKKKVLQSGVIEELRRRERYVKPSRERYEREKERSRLVRRTR